LGPLTELLLQHSAEVLAIEKDARLFEVLKARFAPQLSPANAAGPAGGTRLNLLHEDAVDFLRREPRDWTDWKLVANLPYSVASTILVELAKGARGPKRIAATLQLEVAHRLMANAGEQDYGILTLLIQLHYEPRSWFKIPASCFFPEPDIDSACICLARRPNPLLAPELTPIFNRVVKRSLSQRRKGMLKLLKADWPANALHALFEQLGLSAQTRAEAVPLAQFVALAGALALTDHEGTPKPPQAPQIAAEEIFDVVNERDEVIGRRTRAEVHRLGLMHRAVHVLVFNSRRQVFLQKRSMKKDRQPGLWDSSASGHLESGEEYAACAVRELREEIGLVLNQPPLPLFKLPASPQTDQEHVWVYRCEAEGPFVLNADEVERGDWFDPPEVTRWMNERPDDFAGALRLIWPKCLELKTRLTSDKSQA